MQKMPIWKTLVLPIVTLGIWGVLWIHRTARAAEAKTKEKAPNIWFLIWPVIFVIPMLITIFYVTATSNTDIEARDRLDFLTYIQPPLSLLGLGTSIYYYVGWSKLIEKATNNAVGSTPAALLMIFLSWPIGMPYIQSQINKLNEK